MNLSLAIKYRLIAGLVCLIALFAVGFAYANPTYVGSKAGTALATTTRAFLSLGVGTSTPVYDAYEQFGTNQPNTGNQTLPNTVALLLDGNASSTNTIVSVQCEYSDNWYSGAGDWYQNEASFSSSTNPVNIAAPMSYSFQYGSSTVGGVALNGVNTRFQKMVTCPVLTRFMRAVISVSGANASIWAQFVPAKQRN